MDRKIEAFEAVERIINTLEEEGYDINETEALTSGHYFGEIECEWGASRLVIWDSFYDYVIKVPLEPEYEKYCQREVDIYEAAVEEGLEENFGCCACYQNSIEDGIGIYVMEFLTGGEDDAYNSAWEYGYKAYCEREGLNSNSSEARERFESDYSYDYDNEMMFDFFKSQDETKAISLDSFIYDWSINDLHPGNYLFRDNRLVICDYGGWDW